MSRFAGHRVTRLIAVMAAVCAVLFGGFAMAEMDMAMAASEMPSMAASMCDSCDMHEDGGEAAGAACDVACTSACAILQPETAMIVSLAPSAAEYAPRTKPERAGPPDPYPPKSPVSI